VAANQAALVSHLLALLEERPAAPRLEDPPCFRSGTVHRTSRRDTNHPAWRLVWTATLMMRLQLLRLMGAPRKMKAQQQAPQPPQNDPIAKRHRSRHLPPFVRLAVTQMNLVVPGVSVIAANPPV
jgi:hypothetical protein